jgi:hypothetical protein
VHLLTLTHRKDVIMNPTDTVLKYGKEIHTVPAYLLAGKCNGDNLKTSLEVAQFFAKLATKRAHTPLAASQEGEEITFRVMGDPKKALATLRDLSPSLFPGYQASLAKSKPDAPVTVYAHYQDGLTMRLKGCNWLAAKLARECRPGLKFFRGEGGKILPKKILAQLG